MNNMCPKNNEPNSTMDGNRSDCSIDEERQKSTGSLKCNNMIGYRNDTSEQGTCESLRKFTAKVSTTEVFIGDFDNKTKLVERFAGGSFGELYRGELVREANKLVAVKVEPQDGINNSFLLQEGSVYRNLEGGPGIPKVYWFGYHGSEYRALVMDLLGPTLEDLFHQNKRQFSMKTILMLADQMFSILEHVQSKGFVHRDISPSNFVIGGEGNETKLYLIDFGHSKRFRNTYTVTRRNTVFMPKAVVGTPRFISVHAHLSHEEGPRDDLEALGYIIIYLARGMLPWQGLKAQSMPEKLNKIAEMKMNTPVTELCQDLPEEFAIYINYVRNLKLFEEPDYSGIRALFNSLAMKLDVTYDNIFDWSIQENFVVDTMATCAISIPKENFADDESPNITPVSR